MPRNPDMPCASCGKLIWRSRTSLPRGRATCHVCRRNRRLTATPPKPLKPPRAPAAKKASATARGYGVAHQAARQAFLARWQDGDPCARCFEPMLHGEPVDLDHTDDRSEYLGLSHAECNRARIEIGGLRPRGITRVGKHRPCPICGSTPIPSRRGMTCSRACGVEWKRLAA